MNNNYQYGGWYGGRQWDGTKLGAPGQILVGNNSGSSQNNQTPSFSNSDINKYIDKLMSQSQGQRDLAVAQLDAQHKLALGNNDPQGAQFLETVADGMESKLGQIPYDYQRYTNKELADYANSSQALQQNKQTALDKLANDEKQLGQSQYTANQGLQNDLNSRGLMFGQTAVQGQMGSTPNPINGASGLAGQFSNLQNQDFQNQFGALGIQGQGIQNQFEQGTKQLNTQHDYNLNDIKTNARRGAITENNTQNFGTQGANLNLSAQQQQLEDQRKAMQRQLAALNGSGNF